jgi:hypothetical protein
VPAERSLLDAEESTATLPDPSVAPTRKE